MLRIKKKNIYFSEKTVMIFEFDEQKYLEKVCLKLNLAQSTKQERSLIRHVLAEFRF